MADDKQAPPSIGQGTQTPKQEPTVEEHAQALKTPAWQVAGLKARHGWPIGYRMTRAQFKTALAAWLEGPTVAVAADEVKK